MKGFSIIFSLWPNSVTACKWNCNMPQMLKLSKTSPNSQLISLHLKFCACETSLAEASDDLQFPLWSWYHSWHYLQSYCVASVRASLVLRLELTGYCNELLEDTLQTVTSKILIWNWKYLNKCSKLIRDGHSVQLLTWDAMKCLFLVLSFDLIPL